MSGVAPTTFHGTQEEAFDLTNAIARNCVCTFGIMGVRRTTCHPHWSLVNDQRWLDGLIFMRRKVQTLLQQEIGPQTPVDSRG